MHHTQTLANIISKLNESRQSQNLHTMELVTTYNRYRENNVNASIVGFLIAPPHINIVKTEIIPSLEYWYHRTDEVFHIYCLGYYSKIREYEDMSHLASVNGQYWYFDNRTFAEEIKKLEENCNIKYSGEIDLVLLDLTNRNNQYSIDYTKTVIHHNLGGVCTQNNTTIRQLFEQIIRETRNR